MQAGDLKTEYPNYYVTSDADQPTPLASDTRLEPGGTYYLIEIQGEDSAPQITTAKSAGAGAGAATPAAAEATAEESGSEFEGVDDDLLSYLTLNDTSGPDPAVDKARRSLDSRVTRFGTEDLSGSPANSPAFRSFRGSPGSAVPSPAAIAPSRRRSMGEYPSTMSPILGGVAGAHAGGGSGDMLGITNPFQRPLGGSGLKTMHAASNTGSPAVGTVSRAIGGAVVGQQGSTSPSTHLERRESR
ncbi:unnamed protein product [Closterium sp. Yama58-4]|nr:unnamed protein product [Closterium sp. Yama58-4]